MIGDAHVAAQPIGLVDWYIQLVASSIFHQQVLPLGIAQAHFLQSPKQTNAMLYMHDVGTGIYVGEECFRCNRARSTGLSGRGSRPTEHFRI